MLAKPSQSSARPPKRRRAGLAVGGAETREQKQRERERLRRERMPFEQRGELERKEHDARMKAISAELDEREEAGAAKNL